jgi:hypothetical protein
LFSFKYFFQIKLAITNRNVLPFKITTNQPTCDMNAQICNQVTFDKVIRTDPEVLFTSPDQLKYISDLLEDKELCIWHRTISLKEEAKNGDPTSKLKLEKMREAFVEALESGDVMNYN